MVESSWLQHSKTVNTHLSWLQPSFLTHLSTYLSKISIYCIYLSIYFFIFLFHFLLPPWSLSLFYSLTVSLLVIEGAVPDSNPTHFFVKFSILRLTVGPLVVRSVFIRLKSPVFVHSLSMGIKRSGSDQSINNPSPSTLCFRSVEGPGVIYQISTTFGETETELCTAPLSMLPQSH